jgi:hypothetical protein
VAIDDPQDSPQLTIQQMEHNGAIGIRRQFALDGSGHHPFGPAAIAGDSGTAGLKPHQPVGGEGHGWLALSIGVWNIGQSPGSAVITLLQKQVEVASAGVIRGTGMAQQGITGHGQRISIQLILRLSQATSQRW